MNKKRYYNVWYKTANHWTEHMPGEVGHVFKRQNTIEPEHLSEEEANIFLAQIIQYTMRRDSSHYEIRELNSKPKKNRKPKKIIPAFPLDNTLPILQAGYIQDRQRKLFKR